MKRMLKKINNSLSCRYDSILFTPCQVYNPVMFDKGKRKLNDLGKPDILKFKRLIGGVPTEKPRRMFELFISQSTNEGDLVIDSFLGAGTTCEATKGLKRYSLGIEIDEAKCEIAAKRCSQSVMELGV